MSFITYMVNKKTGKKYAYKQENVWDSEKGQSRAKRTYLGRVDPETGEIIPKRGSTIAADADETIRDEADETVAAQSSASELEEENAKLRARIAELEAALAKLATEALAAIKGNGE